MVFRGVLFAGLMHLGAWRAACFSAGTAMVTIVASDLGSLAAVEFLADRNVTFLVGATLLAIALFVHVGLTLAWAYHRADSVLVPVAAILIEVAFFDGLRLVGFLA